MNVFNQLFQTLPDFSAITILTLVLLLIFFLGVRLLRVPEYWVLIGIGILLFLFSVSKILPMTQGRAAPLPWLLAQMGAMVGLVSMVVALYAFGQWTALGWYRVIKKRTGPVLSKASLSLLRFLRAYHQFLGWVAIVAATLHTVFYIPLLARMRVQDALTQPALLTGELAWVILACLVGLGLWVEAAIKQKRMPQRMRLLHIGTAVFFLLFALLHIGTKFVMK